jgi:hypothetical protein
MRGRCDFALAALYIVFRANADSAKLWLRADHVFHGRDDFLRKSAMGYENDADHLEYRESAEG